MPQEHSLFREKDTAFIALGANLASDIGGPKATLIAAISALSASRLRVDAQSNFYTTPSFPKGNGPDYVNAAVSVTFEGESEDLLQRLHALEHTFGRERDTRWGSRTLDLDLIAHGDRISPDVETWAHWKDLNPASQAQQSPDQLILPHPRLQDRGFVLVPLADIAPDWMHPVLNLSVQAMLDTCPAQDLDEIVRL